MSCCSACPSARVLPPPLRRPFSNCCLSFLLRHLCLHVYVFLTHRVAALRLGTMSRKSSSSQLVRRLDRVPATVGPVPDMAQAEFGELVFKEFHLSFQGQDVQFEVRSTMKRQARKTNRGGGRGGRERAGSGSSRCSANGGSGTRRLHR